MYYLVVDLDNEEFEIEIYCSKKFELLLKVVEGTKYEWKISNAPFEATEEEFKEFEVTEECISNSSVVKH